MSSHYFATLYPEATVLAVEPDPSNVALCRKNTTSLRNVRVVEAAIGSEPGHVSLKETAGSGWGTQTERAASGVPIVTVADLKAMVPNSELFIVKIDIEGFERDLFSRDVDWVSEPCVVAVEPHDWMLPAQRSSRSIQRVMAGQDRDIIVSGENLIWVRVPSPARA